MASTIIWITGASGGIGAGLARQNPHADARIINVSRRENLSVENFTADLTDPASWDRVIDHVSAELHAFRGERAIFVNNAVYAATPGDAGVVDAEEVRRQITANAAAPLVLGDAFLRACDASDGEFDAGLVMMTSAQARHPLEGQAVYCGAKAALEQWVRVVRAERRRLQRRPWVIAVRPGFVPSDALRARIEGPGAEDFPGRAEIQQAIASGHYLTPDESARQIWDLLPPDPDGRNVLFVGEMVAGIDTIT